MEVDCVRETHRHWTAPSLEVRRQQRILRGRRSCQRSNRPRGRLLARSNGLCSALDRGKIRARFTEGKTLYDFALYGHADLHRGQRDRYRTPLASKEPGAIAPRVILAVRGEIAVHARTGNK